MWERTEDIKCRLFRLNMSYPHKYLRCGSEWRTDEASGSAGLGRNVHSEADQVRFTLNWRGLAGRISRESDCELGRALSQSGDINPRGEQGP